MTNRPCKPNTEMQWLWRVLLPDVPLPGCPVATEPSRNDTSAAPINVSDNPMANVPNDGHE
jgi:hypothetical protein